MDTHIMDLTPPPADLRLAYGDDECQFGDLRLPGGVGPHPVALVIHGGYWRARYDLHYMGPLCAALAVAGVATWNIEYRRVGNGGGWPETFADVARAADYLRALAGEQQLDLARVVALGHSAGGHLALWLAARHKLAPDSPLYTPDPLPLRGVVALAPVADLRRAWELGLSRGAAGELMGGAPEQLPQQYDAASPIELLPLGVPQVVLHGDADEAVPFELGERYVQRAIAAGDEALLITLPGAGHFELVDPRAAEWARVRTALLALAGN